MVLEFLNSNFRMQLLLREYLGKKIIKTHIDLISILPSHYIMKASL